MNEQITLDEIYRMLGERDILIYRLQQELAKLQAENSPPESKPNGK